jgi:hypothetical protein
MTSQEKPVALTVDTDESGRPCVMVDRSRAEALRTYLSENGFPSTHLESDRCDYLRLGHADPEEVQKLLDEWTG